MADQRVTIVESDPAWPELFAEQKVAVETVLGPELAGPVQHVGSTAVPGLSAKPVIDMLAPVRSLEQARKLVPNLTEAGWLFWPDDPNRNYRLWFLRPTPETRTHHLYLIERDDPHAVALLAFRDLLRADDQLRAAYASLKTALAHQYSDDRNAYTNAKSDFVNLALRKIGIDPPSRSHRRNRSEPTLGLASPFRVGFAYSHRYEQFVREGWHARPEHPRSCWAAVDWAADGSAVGCIPAGWGHFRAGAGCDQPRAARRFGLDPRPAVEQSVPPELLRTRSSLDEPALSPD